MPKSLPRPLMLILSVVSVLAYASVALAACGDDDGPMTLEEYFTELESLSQAYDANQQDRSDEFTEEAVDIDESDADAIKDLLDRFLSGQRDAADDFVSDLDGLSPPSEAEAAHEAAIAAGEELVETADTVIDEVGDAETADEAIAALSQLDSPGQAFSAACTTLQGIADGASIDVDLMCEGTA